MDEKYIFYYDETEHSRKINLSTISQEKYYDNFITGIVGWRDDISIQMKERYALFEQKYADRKSDGELKSTTIKPKKLKYGFASLDKSNIEFIGDFLDLFDDNIMIYFSVTSKIEYLILQLFKNYENTLFSDTEAMKYSIIKSIVMYRPEKVMEGMYTKTSDLVDILKAFFKERIEVNKTKPSLKEKETSAFRANLLLLDDICEDFEIDWEYQIAFDGFSRYLNNQGIEKYKLFLDMEGEQGRTIKAAISRGLTNVSEIDSKESEGVRWADLFVGLIGKILKSLHNDLQYRSVADGTNKKLLSPGWFRVNDKQLELYKKLHFVLSHLNNTWYKSFSGIYADDLISLVTFLAFMSKFNSADEITQEHEKMPDYLNTAFCLSLESYFEHMRLKLPVDSFSKEINQQDFFVGRRGQKIYFDETNQPELIIGEESKIYKVLAVGISNNLIPTVTVELDNAVECFRLPNQLIDWAVMIIDLANKGVNLFPEKVMFTRVGEDYFANIM